VGHEMISVVRNIPLIYVTEINVDLIDFPRADSVQIT